MLRLNVGRNAELAECRAAHRPHRRDDCSGAQRLEQLGGTTFLGGDLEQVAHLDLTREHESRQTAPEGVSNEAPERLGVLGEPPFVELQLGEHGAASDQGFGQRGISLPVMHQSHPPTVEVNGGDSLQQLSHRVGFGYVD